MTLKTLKGFLSFVAAAVLVAGCETIRNAREAQAEVEPFGRDDSPRAQIVADLNGKSLSELVNFALENRPSMTAAEIAVRDARLAMREIAADAPIVSSTPWNALDADLSLRYTETSEQRHFDRMANRTERGRLSGSLSLDLLVYDFGRNSARAKAQAEKVLVAELALVKEGYTVFNEVESAYFSLLQNDALLEVACSNEQMFVEHLAQAEDRFGLGEAIQLDVLRAKLDLATARETLVSASNDVVSAGARLLAALGIDATSGRIDEIFAVRPGALSRPVRDFNDTFSTAREAFDFAATNAPAMRIARAKLRSASASVDYAIANLMPNVSASFSLNWASPMWYWSWGLSAVESLFTGFRRTTAVDRAVAAMETAESDVRAEELALSRDLELAVAERDNARETLKAARIRVRQSRENLDAVRARYLVGDASRVDFADAVSGYVAALGNRVKSFYAGQIAEAKLFQLIGVSPEFHEKIGMEEK